MTWHFSQESITSRLLAELQSSSLFDVMIVGTHQLMGSAHDILPSTVLPGNPCPFICACSLRLSSGHEEDTVWWENTFLWMDKIMHRTIINRYCWASIVVKLIRIKFSCNDTKWFSVLMLTDYKDCTFRLSIFNQNATNVIPIILLKWRL